MPNSKFVLLLIPFMMACGEEPSKPDVKQLNRLAQLREQIKDELGEQYDSPIPAPTEAQLKRGAKLYPQLCGSCHGLRGRGNGKVVAEGLLDKPTDFTDPQMAYFFSDRARLYIIKKGISGTSMMGWENVLSEDDLLALFHYIRSLAPETKGDNS